MRNFLILEGKIEKTGSVILSYPKTWSPPQILEKTDTGYVIASDSSGNVLDVSITKWDPIEWYVTVYPVKALHAGEKIFLRRFFEYHAKSDIEDVSCCDEEPFNKIALTSQVDGKRLSTIMLKWSSVTTKPPGAALYGS